MIIMEVKLGTKWFREECCESKHKHFHEMKVPHRHPVGLQSSLGAWRK